MKKTILFIVIGLVLVTSWSLLFVFNKDEKPVTVEKVAYRDLKNSIELSGKVVPKNVYTITSMTGGLVKKIWVAQGDTINREDALITLENESLSSELKRAKLELSALKEIAGPDAVTASTVASNNMPINPRQDAAIAIAQSIGIEYAAFCESMGSDDVANESMAVLNTLSHDSIKSTSNMNQIKIADLAVKSLQTSMDDLNLESTIDGEVIAVNCTAGQYISPFMPALVIADMSDLIIEAVAFESDALKIDVNMPATITVNGNAPTDGRISKIGNLTSSITDYRASDVVAKIELMPHDTLDLKLGSSADIEIILESRKNVLSIPVDAIFDETFVYIVLEDELKKEKIMTGFTDGYYIEVISGLDLEDVVVVSPVALSEGDKVTCE